MAHKELGLALLDRIAKEVSAIGSMEASPITMGKTVMMTLIPKS